MLSDALRALREIFAPPYRRVMWLTIALTFVLLVIFGAALQWALTALPEFGPDLAGGWVDAAIEFIARFLAVIVLIPLVHPVVSLVAGLFLETIAARVEEEDYPADPPGNDQPFWQSLGTALRFTIVLIVVNLLALPFYLLPVANVAIFWIVNGYLLGREYFEMVAIRHHDAATVKALRQQNSLRITLAGILIALPLVIPVFNLIVPLFGAAFMVHVYKGLASRQAV